MVLYSTFTIPYFKITLIFHSSFSKNKKFLKNIQMKEMFFLYSELQNLTGVVSFYLLFYFRKKVTAFLPVFLRLLKGIVEAKTMEPLFLECIITLKLHIYFFLSGGFKVFFIYLLSSHDYVQSDIIAK